MTAEFKGFLLFSIIKLLVIFTIVMVGVALLTLMERKLAGWIQNRPGPNRVGPWGILQPAADGIKNFIKEETLPEHSNRWLFVLAPALAFIPAISIIAVVPIAAPLPLNVDWTLPLIGHLTYQGDLVMSIADLPIGFLFILALSSLGVYGLALAGWSSNSKYPLLGGMRASAQMVSYEVALGLSLIPVLLLAGNVTLGEIIARQQAGLWYFGPLFLSFFLFTISGFAETNRLPFDLPEAEAELVAGYHAEYSAMKFSLFMIGEYAHIVTIAAMIAIVFFGGWDIPFTTWDQQGGVLQTIVTFLVFFVKMMFWIFVVMWIRWTLPRFRYDQLMGLGWKVMIPIALVYIMVIATATWALGSFLPDASAAQSGWVLVVLNVVVGWLMFFIIDRGHIVHGVDSRAVVRAAEGG